MNEPDERQTWLDDAAEQARQRIASLYQEGLESLGKRQRKDSSAAPPAMSADDPTAAPGSETLNVDQLGGSL